MSGTVRVAVSGGTFVLLSGVRVVPVGTVVDSTTGSVALSSATPTPSRVQTGQFRAGIFEIRQSQTQGGLTDLVIRDTLPRQRACPTAAAAPAAQRQLAILRGNAIGRFRTVGTFGAATVRGTEWGVRDRCDGTLVLVQRGSVTVRDFRLGKNVVVHEGQSYLASGR